MARIIVTKKLKNFELFQQVSKKLGEPRLRKELHRAVIDAGRQTRTQVQRAVAQQMAVAPGAYQRYVVANMRFRSNQSQLSATLLASEKGGQITDFKGLRALKAGGRASRVANRGRGFPGQVRSGVWNNSRVFKRSYEGAGGGYFALIRANGARGNSTMPKAFWTHDSRANQDRDAQGRFAKMGAQKWRTRRLRGPALNKELDKDQSLATFMRVGPEKLERLVTRKMVSIMKW